jgi:hypothetical protein
MELINDLNQKLAKYFLKLPLPVEMKKDPKLNTFCVSGPFNNDHDKLRRTYYAIRDGKEIPLDLDKTKKVYEEMCFHSPGLWTRNDDTPKELRVLCNTVREFLLLQKH